MSRIIAGRAKGHRLAMPKGVRTRPTTDRTREALFSTLASWFDAADADASSQLAGVTVLDLFAGSGAVGLEAASRGAAPSCSSSQDRPTARLIQDNARATGLAVEVRTAKAEAVAGAPGRAFDLVFLDPPYDLPTEAVETLLDRRSPSGRWRTAGWWWWSAPHGTATPRGRLRVHGHLATRLR